jgi:hypothetical protein
MAGLSLKQESVKCMPYQSTLKFLGYTFHWKIIEQCSLVITDKGIFGPVTFFGYFSILLELSEPGNAPVQIHKTSIAK